MFKKKKLATNKRYKREECTPGSAVCPCELEKCVTIFSETGYVDIQSHPTPPKIREKTKNREERIKEKESERFI